MKKGTCLLLCFLMWGMTFSSTSASEFRFIELNTNSFKSFQLKGDPTPLFLFFLMLSAERMDFQEAQHPRRLLDQARESAGEGQAIEKRYAAKSGNRRNHDNAIIEK